MGSFHYKMNELMPWDTCKREFIRKVTVDSEKIKSLIETAKAG